jgi:hypothetical protein
MAGALACGPAAVLSHHTAAVAHDLLRLQSGRIHVTAPRSRQATPGLTLHRCRRLPGEDRAEVDGLPVTSVCRTLLDVAAIGPKRDAERAFEQALRRRVLDLWKLEALLDRSRGRCGVKAMRAIIADHRPATIETRRELERLFLDLVRALGLPEPASNVMVEGIEVDAFWPAYRLVVELDSYEHHDGLAPFEQDHLKTARLKLAGYEVVRLTWTMVTSERHIVAALLQPHFARPAAADLRR